MGELKEIKMPLKIPFIGHLWLFLDNKTFSRIDEIAEKYDSLYQLVFPTTQFYVVYSNELTADVCDTKKFSKVVDSALDEIRALSGDGLFTARSDEKNWSLANQILKPAFSMKLMKNYIPVMDGIAREMNKNISSSGGQAIDVSGLMTAMTMETIGQCGFCAGFDSFQHAGDHPFVKAMIRSLSIAMVKSRLLPFHKKMKLFDNRKFNNDRKYMNQFVDQIIEQRQNTAAEHPDLLDRMLHDTNKDGEKLDHENIRYQLLTFLIAGHETTAGLLGFCLYLLSRNPQVLDKARLEVDQVFETIGDNPLALGNMSQFKYLSQVLKETQRLYPTAPGFLVASETDQVIGGKYMIPAGQTCYVHLYRLHRDPAVWGSNAEEFIPERFSHENADKIPTSAYRPFGNGKRSCTGQNFAVLESTITLAYILRDYLFKGDPNYRLQIEETMTIKPINFFLQFESRTRKKLTEVA